MLLKKYPFPKGRNMQNEAKVTFNRTEEFKLKDFVIGKKSSFTQTPCLFEIQLLLSCMKENNFRDSLCRAEIVEFHKCYVASRDQSLNSAEPMGKSQIDKLLQKYSKR